MPSFSTLLAVPIGASYPLLELFCNDIPFLGAEFVNEDIDEQVLLRQPLLPFVIVVLGV